MAERITFSVTCPCCGASLVIDEQAKVVADHTPPPSKKETTSFEDRMAKLKEEKRLAEEKFKESVRAEDSKKEVLEQKFQDLFKKAKDEPAGPGVRDIDLD